MRKIKETTQWDWSSPALCCLFFIAFGAGWLWVKLREKEKRSVMQKEEMLSINGVRKPVCVVFGAVHAAPGKKAMPKKSRMCRQAERKWIEKKAKMKNTRQKNRAAAFAAAL